VSGDEVMFLKYIWVKSQARDEMRQVVTCSSSVGDAWSFKATGNAR